MALLLCIAAAHLLTCSLFFISTSLEINHKAMDVVKKSQIGAGVAVKIEHAVYESAKLFGRHFTGKECIALNPNKYTITQLTIFLLSSSTTPHCTTRKRRACLAYHAAEYRCIERALQGPGGQGRLAADSEEAEASSGCGLIMAV